MISLEWPLLIVFIIIFCLILFFILLKNTQHKTNQQVGMLGIELTILGGIILLGLDSVIVLGYLLLTIGILLSLIAFFRSTSN